MDKYFLRRSGRARYMRLSVRAGGTVVVTAPRAIPLPTIEKFLHQHSKWLERATKRMRHVKRLPKGRREYTAHREAARAFVRERLQYWNSFYRFPFGRVAIKNTKTLWGSCSKKGNLNFSYALVFLPREIADYVIVHEICHLKEHNHSPAFWQLVAQMQPEYQRLRRELRTYVLR